MNIAEILKYCPKGTTLYSTAFGEVSFIRVIPLLNTIRVKLSEVFGNKIEDFYKDGSFYICGECILFPSKEQRDWNKFRLPVKRGDIMMNIDGEFPFIATGELYKNISPKYICGINSLGEFEKYSSKGGWTSDFYIPASEEVKKDLFDKMEEAGFKWNVDTLELEKIEHKFKEWDVLINNETNTLFLSTGVIINDKIQGYYLFANDTFAYSCVSISLLKLASKEDRNKLFSAITKKGYRYNKEQHKLIKQDFKPFDKVLVRDEPNQNWSINLFSYYDEEDKNYPYVCLSNRYSKCIPYEGNEHLVGKTVDTQIIWK